VLAFTFINSLGTGVVTSGIFFLTKAGYAFSDLANFGLGLMLGVMYIAGALVAGPALRVLRAQGVSTRGVLGAMMVVLGLLCLLPLAARGLKGEPVWPIWLMVGLYSPLTGVLWPVVESYLSGGKSGGRLRRHIGVWNVVWSSALVGAYWAIAPAIKHYPAEAVGALGLAHVLGLVTLCAFACEPRAHVHEEHAPHPPVYGQLLVTFRYLLPTAYLVSSALGPYLPGLMPRLGIGEQWYTIVATAWLIPRCACFGLLGFWAGWHGRWWPAIAGVVGLVGGFAGCVGAGMIATPGGDNTGALAMLLASLCVFGVGMSVIYSGAIYYAMEVGKAEVDAGGTHEALIGLGYAAGPMCGLFAAGAVERRWIGADAFDPMVLGSVGLVAVSVCALVVRGVVRGVVRNGRGATVEEVR
jgi:hypothetical protein